MQTITEKVNRNSMVGVVDLIAHAAMALKRHVRSTRCARVLQEMDRIYADERLMRDIGLRPEDSPYFRMKSLDEMRRNILLDIGR